MKQQALLLIIAIWLFLTQIYNTAALFGSANISFISAFPEIQGKMLLAIEVSEQFACYFLYWKVATGRKWAIRIAIGLIAMNIIVPLFMLGSLISSHPQSSGTRLTLNCLYFLFFYIINVTAMIVLWNISAEVDENDTQRSTNLRE